jgi:hypothetical protein
VFAVGTAPALLAHQGGWDEFLLIGGPIVIICGLLWLAKRRVDAAHLTQGISSNIDDPDDDQHPAPRNGWVE